MSTLDLPFGLPCDSCGLPDLDCCCVETCVHNDEDGLDGLCAECQAERDEDPGSWAEFGNHSAGLRRWQELQAELAEAQDATPPELYSDIPF